MNRSKRRSRVCVREPSQGRLDQAVRGRECGSLDLSSGIGTYTNSLVTGSTGAIGQPLCSYLIERGHTVRGFARRPTPGLTDFVEADLTDPPSDLQSGATCHVIAKDTPKPN